MASTARTVRHAFVHILRRATSHFIALLGFPQVQELEGRQSLIQIRMVELCLYELRCIAIEESRLSCILRKVLREVSASIEDQGSQIAVSVRALSQDSTDAS